MRIIFTLILVCGCILAADAQLVSSKRMKYVSFSQDTIKLDTLSISIHDISVVHISGQNIDTVYYKIDAGNGLLIWNRVTLKSNPIKDSALITYRVFPMLFSESVKHKSKSMIGRDNSGFLNTYLYTPADNKKFDLLQLSTLNKSGSISRGITFGNNQDVFVNGSFNLQLAGKLSDDVNILAAITDENLPIQPEGNTQQLQEFDKIFIQLSKDQSQLIAGDYDLQRPESYFMNFYKKNQGIYFKTQFNLGQKNVMRTGGSGAISKGKFASNSIAGIEGNQGPYKLRGNNNENYIIVLAGSEKVYVDGQLVQRGTQDDYVINYNTAEISFTPKRLITKDSRIVVEFEYSEKSYVRSLFFVNNEIENKRLKTKFNFYSEQDNRNQPLLLELDSSQKQIMANVGDSIDDAVYNTADSVPYNADRVLYRKTDTTTVNGVFTDIFVYSTNPDSANWQVAFSNVGQGKGDYVLDQTSANGQVYKWIEPISGIAQGLFAPVALLITPKKQQLLTIGGDYSISSNIKAGAELAFSNRDINLFSDKDKANDKGFASKFFLSQSGKLDKDSLGWVLHNNALFEFVNTDFKPIERYRPVEFARDWNLPANQVTGNENYLALESTIENKLKGFAKYQFRSFNKGNNYSGMMNNLVAQYKSTHWNIIGGASLLSSENTSSKSIYLRHNLDINRNIKNLIIGVKENQENNKFKNLSSDSLLTNSFFFQEYYIYAGTFNTLKNRALLNFRYRTDYAPLNDVFRKSTVAKDANLNLDFSISSSQQLHTVTTFRKLEVTDTSLTLQKPLNTLLNRIDYSGSFLKNGIVTSTYYEISTGQELKKEYSYFEVVPGQGSYVWNDYNKNGIKELNEFEVAVFSSEANFVKIVLPSTEYITTKGTQFTEVVNVFPSAFLKDKNNKKHFFSHLDNQFTLQLNKNTSSDNLQEALNPFDQKIADSSLISTNSGIRNTLFFNRAYSAYGLDWTLLKNATKSLLVNGFEYRTLQSHILNLRWNLTSQFLLTTKIERGEKTNNSDFFSSRSYSIPYNRVEPKLSYQPDAVMRFSLSYEYYQKENKYGDGNEHSLSNRLNAEARYSSIRSGIFSVKFSWIELTYNAIENTSISYEMLEGLNAGKNFTWNASIQKNLGNSMQMSLNYEGRKSETVKTVHTGGMQFRAFF